MKSVGVLLTVLLLLPLSAVVVLANHDDAPSIYELHGSGTTNPSKCFWLIMQQFMDRAKLPLHLTYRAVGSSTGQAEFIGSGDKTVPANDFGSGDIPISTANYDALTQAGVEIVHLPFVLGAISVFHSIPNVPDGVGGLNLTSCLLARIFSRDIVVWDHPDILAQNPNLERRLPTTNYPITVAHRLFGSSSTASLTAFLNAACPGLWSADKVGKTITWPADTLACEGSGEMTSCIRNNPGAIGYIDSGHGHAEGLVEIELQNKDGYFLSSKEAAARGGIGSAAGAIPTSPDADFGSVDLLNRPGPDTWPIVTMSYVYVRKDLSFFHHIEEQSLLVLFLRALYEPGYIDQCANLFGFTAVPASIRQLGLSGIGMLRVNNTAPTWEFETSTSSLLGQGDYIISNKRRTYTELETTSNTKDLATVITENENLKILVGELRQQMDNLKTQVSSATASDSVPFTTDEEDQIRAALVLSSMSFGLVVIGMGLFVYFWVCKK